MGKIHSGIRQKSGQSQGNLCNIIDAVIYIIYLAAPAKLTVYRFSYCFLIILHNISLNGDTIHRRLFQNAHVADSDQAHMKSSWNRRGSQSQNINILFQLFDLFLVDNAEALLLINDQKPQVLKLHIL